MARTLYPHHRHINFDAPLYQALAQAALWRRCSLAAFVRYAADQAARADYAARGVSFPREGEAPLPGQATLPFAAPPEPRVSPDDPPEMPSRARPSQGILDPEGVAAVKGFLAAGRSSAAGPTHADRARTREGRTDG